MSNWIFAIIGVGLSYAAGTRWLGMSWQDLALAVAVSNFSGLVSLLLTLQAERVPWIRKHVLNRSLKTWALLATLYFGGLAVGVPPLRDLRAMVTLGLPLIFATGFMIPLFGRIQDAIVRRAQRRERARSEPLPARQDPGAGAAQRQALGLGKVLGIFRAQ